MLVFTLESDAPILLERASVGGTVSHGDVPVRGDGLQVHVEGGLAVVLLPPARAPRGRVHAAVSRRAPRLTPNTSEVTFMSDADGTLQRFK